MKSAENAEFTSTVHILAQRWAEAGPLLPAFPLLARGRPLGVDVVAAASGASVDRVRGALEDARCERDDQGRLIDLFGMALSPTLHRLTIDGRILFSCCALWAHVIPKLVDQIVQLESVDPNSRGLVRISVSPRGIDSAEPEDAMATMVTTSREAVEADVSAAFCSNVRHFVSRESAERFAAVSPARQVVDLATLDGLAAELHRQIWCASGGSDV